MTGDRRGGLRGVGGRLTALGIATVLPAGTGATYAALDLGTNNCRLLVARPTGDGFRVIDAFSRIIRLGEGISASGRISDAAIARAVEALGICRDKMKNRGVTRARLIATEACRAAVNGGEFRARIAEEVGLELEIIDRETEAELAATGCTPLLDPDAEGVILFDIGGGSSELVRLGRSAPCRRGPPLPEIKAWASMPVGVVTLAERHGGHDVTPRGLRGDGAGGGRASRAVRRRQRLPGGRPHASARHLRHGDHHRRRASRAQALRPPPRRRLLDDATRRRPAWSSG